MRLYIVGIISLLLTGTVAAQSRWTFSAGPEWTPVDLKIHVWGMRVRGGYDLIKPTSALGLRLEGAALWTPTQSYFHTENLSGPHGWGGREQRTDLMVGVSASVSPIPRKGFYYYLTTGIYARQQTVRGYQSFAPSLPGPLTITPASVSRGDIVGSVGFGLGLQIGNRAFQLEYRHIPGGSGLTLGIRLPL
ncbi:MAG TPA: hypothetical protein VL549_08755 [Gemmatimonadales bacterium]|jgi:hypothetical protein|nr:hypothetical protein [Gemmatimonadales bacterium]